MLFDVMWTVTVSLLIKQLQICLHQNVHTRYGPHPDPYSLVTGGSSDRGVGMTTGFPLAPRLSMSEVLLQLPLYVFLVCARTTFLYLAVEYPPEVNTAHCLLPTAHCSLPAAH